MNNQKKKNTKFHKGKKFLKKSKFDDDSINFKGKKTNDIKWHTKNATTVADIMSYPFNVMVGNGYNLYPTRSIDGHQLLTNGHTAVMSFAADWYLGSGSLGDQSMLNIAAANLYAFMRQHQSGSTNYQSMDLFTSVFAGTIDIVANIAYIDKIFGIIDQFSNRNRTLPYVLFKSMGINYQDAVNNLANYRAKFNTILAKATSLIIPKEYPIIDQIIALYKDIHIDVDADTGREQIINIVKAVHHLYDATGDPNGGRVKLVTLDELGISGTSRPRQVLWTGDHEDDTYSAHAYTHVTNTGSNKLSLLLLILEKQIDRLILDDDYNTMAGDIMKAFDKYGSGAFVSFQPMERDYKMNIEFSEEFLKQLHNCSFLPHPAETVGSNLDIPDLGTRELITFTENYHHVVQQDPSTHHLFSTFDMTSKLPDPYMGFVQKLHSQNMLIDSKEVNPSPEEVLLITRWQNRYNVEITNVDPSGMTYVKFSDLAMSSIILFSATIYYVEEVGSNRGTLIFRQPLCQFYSASFSGENRINGYIAKNTVSGRPIFYVDTVGLATRDNDTDLCIFADGELTNSVSMDTSVLKRSHEVDFASLLNVPFSGSF